MRLSSAHTSAKRPAMTMRPATGVWPPLLRMRTVLVGASPSAAGRAGPTGLLAAVCVCKPVRAPMWAAELVAFAGRARLGKTMMLVFMAVFCVLSSEGFFESFAAAGKGLAGPRNTAVLSSIPCFGSGQRPSLRCRRVRRAAPQWWRNRGFQRAAQCDRLVCRNA
jgi:hypothetical protein